MQNLEIYQENFRFHSGRDWKPLEGFKQESGIIQKDPLGCCQENGSWWSEREITETKDKTDAIIHAREASSLDRAAMAEEMKSAWSLGEVIKTTTTTTKPKPWPIRAGESFSDPKTRQELWSLSVLGLKPSSTHSG